MRSSWLLVVLIVGCQQHHDPPRGKSQSTKAGGKTLPADVEGTARVPAEVTPPPISPAERRQRAVGDLRDLSPYEQAAFQPDSPAFEALGRPGEGDWRAAFRERPQSFTEYQFAPGNRATDRRNHLYLQPVGSTRLSPKLSYRQLSELLQAFFGLEVELLPVRPTSHFARGARKAPWGLQLSTPGVFAALRARI
ncbi:MAG: hypothetical protein KJO07_22700, partial [Deltaproteobacteria bacterium]|nr:hypothetical protein [Deltaproteobacteria bacterium]